jgi:chromosome segregation ATPase
LSPFRESDEFTEDAVLLSSMKTGILAMEEQMHHGNREIASLRREFSRVQESLDQRIRTEEESASRRANEIEWHVGDVGSAVEKVREARREVRALAERAQTKVESTEAPLGLVARLEAEFSVLSTKSIKTNDAPNRQRKFYSPMSL